MGRGEHWGVKEDKKVVNSDQNFWKSYTIFFSFFKIVNGCGEEKRRISCSCGGGGGGGVGWLGYWQVGVGVNVLTWVSVNGVIVGGGGTIEKIYVSVFTVSECVFRVQLYF